MTRSMLGVLAAGAVASLLAGGAVAADDKMGGGMGGMEAKACYRGQCGKSVSGHEGKCGGTMIDDLKTEQACKDAGGAWATAEEAKKFEKK
jgi:hypothetical protein